MIPDLYLPVTLPGGTPGGFVARDVPTAVLFYGWPGDTPQLEQYELWRERLLPRVVIEPVLSLATVQALGDAAKPPLSGFLAALGWPGEVYDGPEVQVAATAPPGGAYAIVAPVRELIARPHPTIVTWLHRFAETWHLDPLDLWLAPASEFLWRWALLSGGEPAPKRAPGAWMADEGEDGLWRRDGG